MTLCIDVISNLCQGIIVVIIVKQVGLRTPLWVLKLTSADETANYVFSKFL